MQTRRGTRSYHERVPPPPVPGPPGRLRPHRSSRRAGGEHAPGRPASRGRGRGRAGSCSEAGSQASASRSAERREPPRPARQLAPCRARQPRGPGGLGGRSSLGPCPVRGRPETAPGPGGPSPGRLPAPGPRAPSQHRRTGHPAQPARPATTHRPRRASHWLLPEAPPPRAGRRGACREARGMLGAAVRGPASAGAASPAPPTPSGPDAPAAPTPQPEPPRLQDRRPSASQPWTSAGTGPGPVARKEKAAGRRSSLARVPLGSHAPQGRLPGRPGAGARARRRSRLQPRGVGRAGKRQRRASRRGRAPLGARAAHGSPGRPRCGRRPGSSSETPPSPPRPPRCSPASPRRSPGSGTTSRGSGRRQGAGGASGRVSGRRLLPGRERGVGAAGPRGSGPERAPRPRELRAGGFRAQRRPTFCSEGRLARAAPRPRQRGPLALPRTGRAGPAGQAASGCSFRFGARGACVFRRARCRVAMSGRPGLALRRRRRKRLAGRGRRAGDSLPSASARGRVCAARRPRRSLWAARRGPARPESSPALQAAPVGLG